MPSYVVAGASRGMGLEFVKQLLAKGNLVFAIARTPDKAAGLQALKADKNLHILKGDITKPQDMKAAAEATAKVTGGSLDVLINNAAYLSHDGTYNAIDDFESDEALITSFNNNWNTNVVGVVLTTNAFIPLLAKGLLKKVLTLSSGLGDPFFTLETEFEWCVAYSVAKCALEMVNIKYAAKYKKEGWLFLAISPGVVSTAEEAPPADVLPKLQTMAGQFMQAAPHWTGPITPEDSVGKMLAILDKTGPDMSGKFISHLGNREQWL
ncbi:NAD(P)-binding protein [Calocera viscosa TUFC12733]|uniref:NAD(P)-binding protein n=1 Tax=Calocera viscosa (strain TUFC12733) TaxID=1330018 RepID=A0A167HDU4_CALVF|nr:NAD(P)-binding protein [Calocera viscosa TUFC12733]